jgi:hypothetical protein
MAEPIRLESEAQANQHHRKFYREVRNKDVHRHLT